ncbi:hypothetical protein MBLNU230_g2334t1 [Neophaeotheca triangularis]
MESHNSRSQPVAEKPESDESSNRVGGESQTQLNTNTDAPDESLGQGNDDSMALASAGTPELEEASGKLDNDSPAQQTTTAGDSDQLESGLTPESVSDFEDDSGRPREDSMAKPEKPPNQLEGEASAHPFITTSDADAEVELDQREDRSTAPQTTPTSRSDASPDKPNVTSTTQRTTLKPGNANASSNEPKRKRTPLFNAKPRSRSPLRHAGDESSPVETDVNPDRSDLSGILPLREEEETKTDSAEAAAQQPESQGNWSAAEPFERPSSRAGFRDGEERDVAANEDREVEAKDADPAAETEGEAQERVAAEVAQTSTAPSQRPKRLLEVKDDILADQLQREEAATTSPDSPTPVLQIEHGELHGFKYRPKKPLRTRTSLQDQGAKEKARESLWKSRLQLAVTNATKSNPGLTSKLPPGFNWASFRHVNKLLKEYVEEEEYRYNYFKMELNRARKLAGELQTENSELQGKYSQVRGKLDELRDDYEFLEEDLEKATEAADSVYKSGAETRQRLESDREMFEEQTAALTEERDRYMRELEAWKGEAEARAKGNQRMKADFTEQVAERQREIEVQNAAIERFQGLTEWQKTKLAECEKEQATTQAQKEDLEQKLAAKKSPVSAGADVKSGQAWEKPLTEADEGNRQGEAGDVDREPARWIMRDAEELVGWLRKQIAELSASLDGQIAENEQLRVRICDLEGNTNDGESDAGEQDRKPGRWTLKDAEDAVEWSRKAMQEMSETLNGQFAENEQLRAEINRLEAIRKGKGKIRNPRSIEIYPGAKIQHEHLVRTIREKDDQIKEMTEKKDKLSEDYTSTMDDKIELRRKIEQLEATYETDTKKATAEKDSRQLTVDDLRQTSGKSNTGRTMSHSTMAVSRTEALQRMAELYEENRQLAAELDEIEDELDKTARDRDEARFLMDEIHAQKLDLEQRDLPAELKADNEKLTRDNASLKMQLWETRIKNGPQHEEREDDSARSTTAEASVDDPRDRELEELRTEVARHRRRDDERATENLAFTRRVDDRYEALKQEWQTYYINQSGEWRVNQAQLVARNRELDNRITELQHHLHARVGEVQNLGQRVQDLVAEGHNLRSLLATSEASLQAMSPVEKSDNTALATDTTHVQELRAANERLRGQVAALESAKTKTPPSAEPAASAPDTSRLEKLEAELEDANTLIESLNNQLNEKATALEALTTATPPAAATPATSTEQTTNFGPKTPLPKPTSTQSEPIDLVGTARIPNHRKKRPKTTNTASTPTSSSEEPPTLKPPLPPTGTRESILPAHAALPHHNVVPRIDVVGMSAEAFEAWSEAWDARHLRRTRWLAERFGAEVVVGLRAGEGMWGFV